MLARLRTLLREPCLGILGVGGVLQGLGRVCRLLVGERHRAGERAGGLDLLVHRDLVDGRPGIACVIANSDQAHAVDLLEAEVAHRDGARGVLLRVRNVLPLPALEVLDLAGIEEVLAAALDEGNGVEVERLVLRHAKVVARGNAVGVAVLGARRHVAVEHGVRATHRGVGAVGHELGQHRVRIGRERGLLGYVVVQLVDRGRDVGLTHARLLIVVDVPQLVVVRLVQLGRALGELGDQLGIVAGEGGLHRVELGDGRGREIVERLHPRHHLLEHGRGARMLGERLGVLLDLLKDRDHLVAILCGHRVGLELGAEVRQIVLDVVGLAALPRGAAAVHAAHVHGDVVQGVRALIRDGRVVVDVAKGLLPRLVGVLLGLPQVPREVGVHEDALLGGLGLLHGVDHNALDLTRLEVGAQKAVVAAHVQGVLVVVGARPVDPHKGSHTGVALERRGELVIDLAPHAAAGVDDLDRLGQIAVPSLAIAHVVHRAEDERVLEAGVLERAVLLGGLLLLVQPVGHLAAELDVEVLALIGGVVSQDGDLAHAVIHDLGELVLEDLDGLLVVVLRDRVTHERVQGEHKAALGLVARLGERLDLFAQLVLRIQLAPLGVVLGVVLGRVEIRVQLVVTAPRHEVHAVLGTPRVAVVALDKAAGDDVGVVAHREGAQRAALDLLQNLVQRGESVVRGVRVLAQHDDLIGRLAVRRQGCQQVGIGLFKQPVGVGELALLHELVDVRVDNALGTLDAHEDRGARLRDGVALRALDALERERLVQTRGGIGVKTGLEDRRDVLVYGHLALCVRDGLRRGVYLVPTLGRLRHTRCAEHACTCEHGRGKRAYARPKPLRHTASFFHKTPHRMRGTKYRQTGAYSSKGRSAHRSRFGERRA